MVHVKSWVFTVILGTAVVGSGCTTPRAKIGGGVFTTFLGAAALGTSLAIGSTRRCPANDNGGGCEFNNSLRTDIADKGYVLSAVLLVLGLGYMASGLVETSHEPTATTRPAIAMSSRPPVESVTAAGAMKPAADAAAPSSGPPDHLAAQLGIAAHAGRCETAAVLARQLIERDARAMRALLERDADVARCMSQIGYRI